MREDAYHLDTARRCIVLRAIRQTCERNEWQLLAAHVRSTHVHVLLIFGRPSPDRVMNALKCTASRLLNEASIDAPGRKRWTRHGSTVPIRDSVERAIAYVADRQGAPMELYVAAIRSSD